MDIHKLELQGIGTYTGKVELDFDKINLVLVKGKNGSGKSWLFDGLVWTLYDETIRGFKKDEVVNEAIKEGIGKVYCTDDKGNLITVVRTRKPGKILVELLVNGAEKSGTTTIPNIFGMNFTLFKNSCMFGQNDLLDFAEATDKQRKDIIGYLLGFNELDTWLVSVRKAKGAVEKITESLVTSISINMQQLSKIVIEDMTVVEFEINAADTILVSLEEERKKQHSLLISLEKQHSLEKQKQIISSNVILLRKEVSINQSLVEQKQSILSRLAGINSELGVSEEKLKQIPVIQLKEESVRKTVSELVSLKGISELELSRFKVELDELSSFTGNSSCPKCKQLVSEDWVKEQTSSLTSTIQLETGRLKEVVDKLRKETKDLGELLDQKKALDSVREDKESLVKSQEQLLAKILLIETTEKTLQEQSSRLLLLEQDLSKIEQELRELGIVTIEDGIIERINQQITENKDRKDKLYTRKGVAQQQQQLKTQTEISLKQNESDMKDLKRKLEIYSVLEDALGQSGLRNVLIENLIPIMTQKANEYLNLLLDGVTISFDTVIQGKTVVKDEFAILIHDNRSIMPTVRDYKGWSGGEKLLIALVLRLVLWNIGYMKSSTRMNFLLLDEILGCLDPGNRERVIELLVKLNREYGIKIMLIEHLEELEDRFPQVLSVTKEDGTSRIEWVKE